jgi:hypothetical protein
MFLSDTTHINFGTLGLFLLVLVGTGFKAKEINKAHYNITGSHFYNTDWEGELRLKKMEWMERAAGWMLFLGLIGTLFGLMLSLSAVNTGNLGNVEGIKQIAVQMMTGLRVELSTTIIGAMLALWTEVNYIIVKYTADQVVYHEEDARARSIIGGEDESLPVEIQNGHI